MIDRHSEELLTLAQAASRLPGRGDGRSMCSSTLWRWSREGCLDIKLETIMLGLTTYTSTEAVDRFFAAVAAKKSGTSPPGPTPSPRSRRTPARRRQASEQAARKLAAKGA